MPEAMEQTGALDLRGVMSIGLFASDGHYLDGNIERLPPELPVDGKTHALPHGLDRRGRETREPARGLAKQLPTGEVLVIARDTSVIDQVALIIRDALLWGVSLTILPGLIGGMLLARGPLRRVRAIEAAVEPIARGDLGRRLPVSGRGDEVDLLAAIVNRMLVDIERLIGEVKGVCDNIAHDLRTPLTRLRAELHRLQRTHSGADIAPAIERCIVDVDSLLDRFPRAAQNFRARGHAPPRRFRPRRSRRNPRRGTRALCAARGGSRDPVPHRRARACDDPRRSASAV